MICGSDLEIYVFFFFQAEDGIRDTSVTGVQTCALPILSKVAGAVEIPMVATNRPVSQRGSFARSESERLSLLMDAVEGGADYVDIESSTSHLDQVIDTFQIGRASCRDREYNAATDVSDE